MMIAALIGVAGFAYYVRQTPAAQHVADDMRRDQVSRPAPRVTIDVKPAPKDFGPQLLVPRIEGGELKLSQAGGAPPAGEDAKAWVLGRTLEELGIKEGRILKVDVQDKVATVAVNQGFIDHGYGSMEEGQLVKALQMALGQFADVDKFVVQEEGQPVELGHIDWSEPMEVTRERVTKLESSGEDGP